MLYGFLIFAWPIYSVRFLRGVINDDDDKSYKLVKAFNVKLHLRDKESEREKDTTICLFVLWSVS